MGFLILKVMLQIRMPSYSSAIFREFLTHDAQTTASGHAGITDAFPLWSARSDRKGRLSSSRYVCKFCPCEAVWSVDISRRGGLDHTHGIMVLDVIYENVSIAKMNGRVLAKGEREMEASS
jgi:hypothetical protein